MFDKVGSVQPSGFATALEPVEYGTSQGVSPACAGRTEGQYERYTAILGGVEQVLRYPWLYGGPLVGSGRQWGRQ